MDHYFPRNHHRLPGVNPDRSCLNVNNRKKKTVKVGLTLSHPHNMVCPEMRSLTDREQPRPKMFVSIAPLPRSECRCDMNVYGGFRGLELSVEQYQHESRLVVFHLFHGEIMPTPHGIAAQTGKQASRYCGAPDIWLRKMSIIMRGQG